MKNRKIMIIISLLMLIVNSISVTAVGKDISNSNLIATESRTVTFTESPEEFNSFISNTDEDAYTFVNLYSLDHEDYVLENELLNTFSKVKADNSEITYDFNSLKSYATTRGNSYLVVGGSITDWYFEMIVLNISSTHIVLTNIKADVKLYSTIQTLYGRTDTLKTLAWKIPIYWTYPNHTSVPIDHISYTVNFTAGSAGLRTVSSIEYR